MAIEIIKPGRLPEEKRYRMTCSNCKAEFVMMKEDGKIVRSGYNENALKVRCPTKGCNKDVYSHDL